MTIEVESAHLVVHLIQRSALYGVNLRKKLWKCSQRSLKEDNPLGDVLFMAAIPVIQPLAPVPMAPQSVE